jgi:hypothetical protein
MYFLLRSICVCFSYLGAVIAIIAGLALASVSAFTLAQIVRLDYSPSQYVTLSLPNVLFLLNLSEYLLHC